MWKVAPDFGEEHTELILAHALGKGQLDRSSNQISHLQCFVTIAIETKSHEACLAILLCYEYSR